MDVYSLLASIIVLRFGPDAVRIELNAKEPVVRDVALHLIDSHFGKEIPCLKSLS